MLSPFDLAPAQWMRLRRLLDEALERPAGERQTWIDALAGDDADLAPRLRSLLAHAEPPALEKLLHTLPKIETAEFAGTPPPGEPRQVGPYRLLRQIGEGGMASVWLAERTDMLQGRRVALKLPHDAWRREGLAQRLAREREILATLAHPNIARLYDAGVPADGQPYLALEYVEGERIDAYCERKQLDVPARLRLVLQVARAVAHAHANLVVHRDLKPSNILVTEAGEVKLLDFGIAKLMAHGIAEETELTQQSGRALTPDYAAPEQILGRPIGTGADVYALGVLLYELLSGRRPYQLDRASRAALEEAILHAEPARPSTTASDPRRRKAMRGDLDTIVMKALKKDPAQRYATADALADDIARHLADQPVHARPDSRGYVLRKFVVRHKVGAAAGGAVLLAVVGGAGAAWWQARLAQAEQHRAEQVKDFIASIFRDASPFASGGSAPSAAELLRKASARIDGSLAAGPEVRAELRAIVGQSLFGMNDVQGAIGVLDKAVDEARLAWGPDHPRTLHARVLRTSAYRLLGRTAEMRQELDALLPAMQRTPGTAPRDLVHGLRNRAHLAIDDARYDDAVAAATQARDLAFATLGPLHADAISASMALAEANVFANRKADALRVAEETHQLALQAHRDAPRHPTLIETARVFARALGNAGELDRAVVMLREAQRGAHELYGPASVTVGFLTQNLVGYELQTGEIRQALADSAQAHRIQSAYARPDSYVYQATAKRRGDALLAARDGAALPLVQQAREAAGRIFGPQHRNTLYARADLALALAHAGRLDAARQAIGEALADVQPSKGHGYRVFHVAGVLARRAGDATEALAMQQRAQQAHDAVPPEKRVLDERLAPAEILIELGLATLDAGRAGDALPLLERGLAELERLQRLPTPTRADAWVGLGRAQLALGRPALALPPLQQADAFWRDFDAGHRDAAEAASRLAQARTRAASRR